MLILASYFGPSEKAIWVAVLVIVAPAAFVGFFARSPLRGFMVGALTSGGLTFLWLGVASNKAMGFAAIFTPIFAVIGGLVGSFFGVIGRLVWGEPQQPRQRIAEQTPFEFRVDSESKTPSNQQPDANEHLPGPDSERDAV